MARRACALFVGIGTAALRMTAVKSESGVDRWQAKMEPTYPTGTHDED